MTRPSDIDTSHPILESVWDYPRPPDLVRSDRLAVVEFGGRVIAETRRADRVRETSHPPAWAFPPEDVDRSVLHPASVTTMCEWKGRAIYWDLVVGDDISRRAAWSYPDPVAAFAPIAGWLFFYPGRVDRCLVDGEVVIPQEGDFYGGWITSDVVGPFKGGPGTRGW
ncbi:MAG: DUF427 domain-containing protein [Acidimicrobiia bacterium]|nr:DUF427 domain-containing protein [Acidimicrobiia bacterium]